MSESAQPLGNLLNGLMENPEMLQQAMRIAGSLASSGMLNDLMKPTDAHSQPASDSASAPASAQSSSAANSPPDMAALGNLLAGLGGHSGSEQAQSKSESPQTPPRDEAHPRQSSHPSEHHVGHSERIALLRSLRPFLPSDKQEKIDFVIKLLGLLDAAERMGLGKLF